MRFQLPSGRRVYAHESGQTMNLSNKTKDTKMYWRVVKSQVLFIVRYSGVLHRS